VERVLDHPCFHGGRRREASGWGRPSAHQPVVFVANLWGGGAKRACPSAGSAAQRVGRASIGPTTLPRTSKGSGSAVEEAWDWPRRRTENPSGCSPRGVSNQALPASRRVLTPVLSLASQGAALSTPSRDIATSVTVPESQVRGDWRHHKRRTSNVKSHVERTMLATRAASVRAADRPAY
jgi:hypothetical protein